VRWGDHPELVGPRHRFRSALMVRALLTYLPPPSGAPPAGAAPVPTRSPAAPPNPIQVRLLDAGAGRGTLALALAHHGYHVTALERSAAFLHYLRGTQRGGGAAPRLALVQGDLTALPCATGAFDGVVCGEVLEHVADDHAAVAELARVLRPGGVLVATVPAGEARYGWLDRWAGHARRYELAALRALVSQHGFDILRLHHWGFPFGLLYERLVQRPVLARHARAGALPPVALRWSRTRWVQRVATVLFRLDHLCDPLPWGPGLLLVAQRQPAAIDSHPRGRSC
jgi:SAM-dependent methyltransferase